jgi:HAD superfamily hydrolase (TIGR01549 family)
VSKVFEVEGVVFDIDGTLFDTRTAAVESLKLSCAFMSDKYGIKMEYPGDERFFSVIGMPSVELYRKLYPEEMHKYVDELREVIRGHETRIITSGKASLYPRVRETLARLKSMGLKIAYFSNASPQYFHAIIRSFKLDEFNVVARCHGETGLRKPELLKLVKEESHVEHVAVVGDRSDDMSAAKANGDFGIGAGYGFGKGEIAQLADAVIGSIVELPGLLRLRPSSGPRR